MRILFHLGGENIGGNETLLFELSGFLKEQGHSLILITKKSQAADFLAPRFESVLSIPENFNEWQAVFQNQKVDCAFGFYGEIFSMARAAKSSGVKTLWCCGHPCDLNQFPSALTLLFDLIVTQSEYLAKGFKKASVPVQVCYNGIDLNKFDLNAVTLHQDFREQYNISNSKFLIGYPARLVAYKRHRKAIEILSEINQYTPNCHLIFAVGASSQEQQLEEDVSRLAREHKVDHQFSWARVSPEQMPNFYGALDLVIFPALNEGFGIGVIEAMAMQLPVVASAGGGVAEILEHSNAGICIEESEKSNALFAKSIFELYSDSSLRLKMGRSARKRVEQKFNREAMNQRYIGLIEQLVGLS